MTTRFKTLFLMGMFVAATAWGCDQQTPAPAPNAAPSAKAAPTNAAAEYRRIHATLGRPFLARFRTARQNLTPELIADLESKQTLISELTAASRLAECDFHIDYSQGAMMELPHLAEVRELATLLVADAVRLAKAGDQVMAAERAAALLRMTRHAGQENLVLAKLVAFANLGVAADLVAELLALNGLHPSGKQVIAAELRAIDSANPFNAKGALAGERRMLATPIPDGQVADLMFGPDYRALSAEQRQAAMREAVESLEKLEKAWDGPQAVARMQEIESRIGNPIAKKAVARMSSYRKQADTAAQRVRDLLAKLEQ